MKILPKRKFVDFEAMHSQLGDKPTEFVHRNSKISRNSKIRFIYQAKIEKIGQLLLFKVSQFILFFQTSRLKI